ncbi:hypothetical protein SAMN04487939_101407 [Lysobacter sp. yr284]|uniref:hypothetical protein n=1 Tax=Lysobacter sp. yr284 TaxID=1761791 RepID=UPI00089BCDD0|nr:hypothetical protein [Lysobacter sp. yr284]SDY23852.1 hypothetical protein SAMN04487939_101407 [Lysobacter sp. yr284]
MSQPQDPRRYDRLAVELSRIRDPQALAEAIVAAARAAHDEPAVAAAAPQEQGERAWIEA